jgi:hypothetical protein
MSDHKYVTRVKGRFDGSRSDLFESSEFTYIDGVTTISSILKDRAALHELLNRIRDLNLELISLEIRRKK